MKKAIKIFIITILLLAGSSGFALAESECTDAQTKLEIKLPGLDDCINGPADYLSGIYKLSLGVGVFLAAMVIVMAGIKYAISGDNGSKQKEAKDDIFQAIFGLVVLFGSVIILRTINPDLTDLGKLQKLPSISPIVTSDAALSEDCKEFRRGVKECLDGCRDPRVPSKMAEQCAKDCNIPPAVDPCSVQENGGGSGGAE